MKKSVIMSIVSILAFNNAMALDIKPFVGGNISINGVVWSDEVDRNTKDIGINLPDGFLGLGAEAGVRFSTTDIYNAGITLAYDYLFDSKAELNSYLKQYFDEVAVGFSIVNFTFDNYIRVFDEKEHRGDIVLGVGFAWGTERASIKTTYFGESQGLEDYDDKDDGTFIVVKVGCNQQVAKNTDWYVNGRAFIPTKGGGDMDAGFNLSTGLNFMF